MFSLRLSMTGSFFLPHGFEAIRLLSPGTNGIRVGHPVAAPRPDTPPAHHRFAPAPRVQRQLLRLGKLVRPRPSAAWMIYETKTRAALKAAVSSYAQPRAAALGCSPSGTTRWHLSSTTEAFTLATATPSPRTTNWHQGPARRPLPGIGISIEYQALNALQCRAARSGTG
jgi:hypothetical protein